MIPVYNKTFYVKKHHFLASVLRAAGLFSQNFQFGLRSRNEISTQVFLLYGRKMYLGRNGLAGFLQNIFNFSKNGSFERRRRMKVYLGHFVRIGLQPNFYSILELLHCLWCLTSLQKPGACSSRWNYKTLSQNAGKIWFTGASNDENWFMLSLRGISQFHVKEWRACRKNLELNSSVYSKF